jgi:DNA-binding transcriptional LysR family regulator
MKVRMLQRQPRRCKYIFSMCDINGVYRVPRKAVSPRRVVSLGPSEGSLKVSMPRLRQMQYLVAIADEGQMTRAARKLHVAQPALSHAISQLERQLGVRLLERHAHGVSLTPAGEAFLPKARTALAAVADAELAAQTVPSTSCDVIEFGFLGIPPGLDSPGPLEAFSQAHPNIEVRFQELPFPSVPSKSWLANVDVAVCHEPRLDSDGWTQVFRREPRVVLAPEGHALARRGELRVADVLDETFIGLHPSVEPTWAGFWSLDDHRGGPPKRLTPDHADNPQEVLASLAVRGAITTVPASVARLMSNAQTGVVAIPLRDAAQATITLVGHHNGRNPHVAALRNFAREIAGSEP